MRSRYVRGVTGSLVTQAPRRHYISPAEVEKIMPSRTGNWMVAVGALLGFAGLCVLPAAMGNRADSGLLGLGASIFALGMLIVAGGMYLKAVAMQGKLGGAPEKPAANSTKRPRGGCDLCHTEMPVIHCKVHQFHLCGTCLAEHYDFRACVYVPSTRRTEKPAKSMSARAHG